MVMTPTLINNASIGSTSSIVNNNILPTLTTTTTTTTTTIPNKNSFQMKRKLGLTINIEQPTTQRKLDSDIQEIIIQEETPPTTPLSQLSLSFSSSNPPSDISSDSSNSAPNTPRNIYNNNNSGSSNNNGNSNKLLNLKLNLQQLQQHQQFKYKNSISTQQQQQQQQQYQYQFYSSNSTSDDESPLESSRWLGCNEMDKLKIYNLICSKVTDYLYMGSESIASNINILKSYGITHIINASLQCPNYFEEDSTSPFIYKKFPLQDNPSEEISWVFSEAIEFIENALSVGGKIFIHCQMGVSRSTCLCMLWLMKVDRCSLEEASDRIQSIRPISRPNAGFQLSLLNWAIKEGIQAPNSHRASYNNNYK